MRNVDVIIIGGGAAGFFTAINAVENNPELKIIILERGKEVLNKVRISGGGRCNVTHAEFIPLDLTQNYPRGEKELLGPFHTFMTGDTITWFEKRGVSLKIEEDGRMFPDTDSSQTIIDCFLSETKRLGIEIMLSQPVRSISREDDLWKIETSSEVFSTEKIVVATGSNPKVWKMLKNLGHSIVSAVPSLFTFNIKDDRIIDLPGLSTDASVKVLDANGKSILESQGPLLITHWGMSGPAILKLSAWGARLLEPTEYKFSIEVNWLDHFSTADTLEKLKDLKNHNGKQTIYKYPQFELPRRLWQSLMKSAGIVESLTWAEAINDNLQNIAIQLTKSTFEVNGKSTFKEEFVTAGGVDLKEVNFKSFESKIHSNLFLVGEVLNIDAITGGFNFQNAWTSGFIVAKNL